MIKIFYRNLKSTELENLAEFRVGSWVHVQDPDKKELNLIAEQFDLDTNILADALDPFEVPRIEKDEDRIYIFTRCAIEKQDRISTTPLLIVVGASSIITISQYNLSIVERFAKQKIPIITTQKTKFLLQLFLTVGQEYQLFINRISKTIRNLSSDLETLSNKDLARFVQYESILNDFLSALQPGNHVVSKLTSGKYVRLYEEDKELVEDVFLNNNQLIEISKTNLKHIVNIREAYSTIISNNLNKTMKLLTGLTLILTIPTMISSFFGMNVPVPFANAQVAFVGIVLFASMISVGLVFVFFKKELL